MVIIGAVALFAWSFPHFSLSVKYKDMNWDFWDYKRVGSLRFMYLITTAILASLLAFCVIFEVSWAILGIFLEPGWAIPLLTLYASFVINIYIWVHRIYSTLAPFKWQLRFIVMGKMIERAIFEHFRLSGDIAKELDQGVVKFLKDSGLALYGHIFQQARINMPMLKVLSDSDVDGLNMPLGARLLLKQSLHQLSKEESSAQKLFLDETEDSSKILIEISSLLTYLKNHKLTSSGDKVAFLTISKTYQKDELGPGDITTLMDKLKQNPLQTLELLEEFVNKALEAGTAPQEVYQHLHDDLELWRKKASEIADEIQNQLGFGEKELVFYAVVTTVVFLMMAFFVFWGFRSITHNSITLGLLQSVIIAIVAFASKIVSDWKTSTGGSGIDTSAIEKDVQNSGFKISDELGSAPEKSDFEMGSLKDQNV